MPVKKLFVILMIILSSISWSRSRAHADGISEANIELNVKSHLFKNGLQLLVVERNFSPTISCIMRFKVGSVDERPGITGSAHLLEHMLFKGTKKLGTSNYKAEVPLMAKIDTLAKKLTQAIVANYRFPSDTLKAEIDSLRSKISAWQAEQRKYIIKDEIWDTYLRNGGSVLNASTSNDGTQYFVSLPSNKFELWTFIESDRMANPILREFYSERDVVYEERRLRTDNDPFGKLEEQFSAAAFTAHPYSWPVIGWASDIETVLREQVEDFYFQYYSPNNAVAVIVGDIKFEDAVKLVGRYFENIPPSKIPPPPVTTIEPEQKGERRIEVEYDSEPIIMIGWHEPAAGGKDIQVFDIISYLLTRGRTSRLYKVLVEEKQLVTSINASSDMARYPSLFTIYASPKAPHSVDEVERAIYEEIERLKTEGPSEWELQRVRNQLEAEFVRGMQSNLGMAFRLSNMQAIMGDWEYIRRLKELRTKVTSDDVKRILAAYFTAENRTVASSYRPNTSAAKVNSASSQTHQFKEAIK